MKWIKNFDIKKKNNLTTILSLTDDILDLKGLYIGGAASSPPSTASSSNRFPPSLVFL